MYTASDTTAAMARQVISKVARVARLMARPLEKALAAEGITLPEFRVMGLLLGERGITQRELSERLGVRSPSLTPVLASLERQGRLTRQPHPTDARSRLLSAKVDVEELGRVAALLEALEVDILQGAAPSDIEACRRVLDIAIRNLGRGS